MRAGFSLSLVLGKAGINGKAEGHEVMMYEVSQRVYEVSIACIHCFPQNSLPSLYSDALWLALDMTQRWRDVSSSHPVTYDLFSKIQQDTARYQHDGRQAGRQAGRACRAGFDTRS